MNHFPIKTVLIAALNLFVSTAFATSITFTGGGTNGASGNVLSASAQFVGSSRVDLQACKLEYSIVSPK